MKTHRQALIERLNNEFGITVNQTPATIEHLLLLCDMLDERADQFPDVRKKVEATCHCQLEAGDSPCPLHGMDEETEPVKAQEPPATFPINFVTRLHFVYEDANGAEEPSNDPDKVYLGIRAVLSELASMPCELPTEKEIEAVIVNAYERKQYDAEESADIVHRMLVCAVAPIIAAKDAEVKRQQQVIRLQNKLAENHVLRGVYETHVADLKARVAELESHTATPTAQAAQYKADRDHVEETCRMHSERVIALEKELSVTNDVYTEEREERGMYQARCVELEKHIAELESRTLANEVQNSELEAENGRLRASEVCLEQLIESFVDSHVSIYRDQIERMQAQSARIADLEIDVAREKNFGDAHFKNCEAARADVVRLEKRIAELAAPVDANGKTPGQVARDTWDALDLGDDTESIAKEWEIVAQAVLRGFDNGAEALKRVRDESKNIDTHYYGQDDGVRYPHTAQDAIEMFATIIDAELAKLA